MHDSMVHTLMQGTPVGVQQVDDVEELSAIHRPGNAAVIWHRHPLKSFQNWIDTLSPENLPSARIILRPDGVRDAATHLCDRAGTPDCANRTRLIDDIAALADIFASTMRARWLRLRLDLVTTNACRKFHVDAVQARLVCTYRGTGTQYGTGLNGTDPDRIFTVPPSSPIILRGTRWPERTASGLLHRSPPIKGTGETRLLLVLDPVDEPEDEI